MRLLVSVKGEGWPSLLQTNQFQTPSRSVH
jgi:hypothetical protein